MTIQWDPKRYHDDYHDQLLKWVEEKAARGQRGSSKKKDRKVKEHPSNSKVVDFMELLKKSVKAQGSKEKNSSNKAKNARATRKPPSKKTK